MDSDTESLVKSSANPLTALAENINVTPYILVLLVTEIWGRIVYNDLETGRFLPSLSGVHTARVVIRVKNRQWGVKT